MTKKLGGNIECFYYCFGDVDVVCIVDVPDPTSAAAVSMAINSTGAVKLSMTPLLLPSDIVDTTKITVGYQPPCS